MTQYDISGSNYSEQDSANNNPGAAGWAIGQAPSNVGAAGRAFMGSVKRAYDWDHGGTWAAVTGTANAIVITYPVAPSAYVQGQKHAFKATAANTGATTVNINSLGAKNIFQRSPTGPVALIGGEIQVGDIVEIAYDGTEFVMIGLASNTAATPSGAVMPYAGLTVPAGWLFTNGQAVSRATYAALFAAITVSFTGNTASGSPTISNTPDLRSTLTNGIPISGPGIPVGATVVSGTVNSVTISANCTATASGITAVAAPHGVGDGSATFNVPDMRGRVAAGYDAGNATSRLNGGYTGGLSASLLGNAGGEQGHAVTINEMPSHNHNFNDPGHGHSINVGGPNAGGSYVSEAAVLAGPVATSTDSSNITIQAQGGNAAHNNVQPTLVLNYIIKT